MREAVLDDYDSYFKIKSDPLNVMWSGFSAKPDYDALKKRFRQFFDDPKQCLLLFENKDEIIGYVNFFYTVDGKNIETSHGALSDHKVKSLGSKMLKMVIQYLETNEKYIGIQSIVGWVAENNIASLQNVLKNGYKATGKFEYRLIMGNNTKFLQYKRERSA